MSFCNNAELWLNNTTVCHSVAMLSYGCIIPERQHEKQKGLVTNITQMILLSSMQQPVFT
jgi:hypothetical protein